jgi:hypothetical protein
MSESIEIDLSVMSWAIRVEKGLLSQKRTKKLLKT